MTGGRTTGSADDRAEAPWTHHRWPHTPRTARSARTHLRSALRQAGVDGQVGAEAELVLTELVTNAIRHGAPDADGNIDVAWSLRDDRVLLSVHDSGHTEDLHPGDLDTSELSGRGLALVDTLSDRWSWNADGGTHVTAELLIP